MNGLNPFIKFTLHPHTAYPSKISINRHLHVSCTNSTITSINHSPCIVVEAYNSLILFIFDSFLLDVHLKPAIRRAASELLLFSRVMHLTRQGGRSISHYAISYISHYSSTQRVMIYYH